MSLPLRPSPPLSPGARRLAEGAGRPLGYKAVRSGSCHWRLTPTLSPKAMVSLQVTLLSQALILTLLLPQVRLSGVQKSRDRPGILGRFRGADVWVPEVP